VTRATGCGQFVQKMDLGYTINYGNETELKYIMNFILDNPKEAQIKAEKGKQYLVNNLSWESVVEEYEKLYQYVVNGIK
jgi:glycosyltransferase involved in cell wall biosynthesis